MQSQTYRKHNTKNVRQELLPNEDIGHYVTLKVRRFSEHGVYLGKEGAQDTVLLPGKEQPKGLETGDELRVFVYRDSADRPIATVTEPRLTVGQTAALTVRETTRIGAFLDWGLEKDLLLPFGEMTTTVEAGDTLLVSLYVDKSGRLCATQKHLYDLLSTNAPYRRDDEVTGRVYEFGKNFGTFVAVDDKYSAMIPKKEDTSDLKIGDLVTLRVIGVKEDGKLDVSRRGKAYTQIGTDAERVLALIDQYGGSLPFDDKASPERIFSELSLSKAAFKRAVGRLYKERKVEIKPGSIVRTGS